MTGAYLVATLILFSLLYATQLYFNRNLWLKLVNVTVLIIISSAVYFTFETYKGWPTIEKLHEKARVMAVIIDPPVKGVTEGAIYYWVLEKNRDENFFNKVFRYQPTLPKAPRSYHLPYTPEAEREFSKAQQALQNGDIVMMDPNKPPSEGEGEGQKPGNAKDTDAKNKGRDGQEQKYDVPNLEIITPEEFMGKQQQ